MFRKTCRIAAIAATLAALGAMSAAAAPASAAATFPTPDFQTCFVQFLTNGSCLPFTPAQNHWPVRGTITANTSNQTFTLPAGSSFTGADELEIRGAEHIQGTILGGHFTPFTEPCPQFVGCAQCPNGFYVYNNGCFTPAVDGTVIPSFTTSLEFPQGSGQTQTVGMTLAPIGIVEASLASDPGTKANGTPCLLVEGCVKETVPLKVNMEVELVGPGNGSKSTTPTRCKTVTPIDLPLSTHLTVLEIVAVGSHFEGTTTVPAFTCNPKPGTNSSSRADQLSADLSGPGSYVLDINPT